MSAQFKKDIIILWFVAASALCIAVLINQFRHNRLPLMYESKEERLGKSVQRLATQGPVITKIEGEILKKEMSLEEFSAFVNDKQGIILDARPEVFYRLGHVPGALSLPRDDFENAYKILKSTLESHRAEPMVIYCSGGSCEDSGLVYKSLMDLGYTHLAVYEGGWSEWTETGNLQEITK